MAPGLHSTAQYVVPHANMYGIRTCTECGFLLPYICGMRSGGQGLARHGDGVTRTWSVPGASIRRPQDHTTGNTYGTVCVRETITLTITALQLISCHVINDLAAFRGRGRQAAVSRRESGELPWCWRLTGKDLT